MIDISTVGSKSCVKRIALSQAVVYTTICGGRILMEGRKLAIDLDEVEMARRSRELAVKLWDRF